MKVAIPPRPNRKLGQNFLHDDNVLEKIVAFLEPSKTDIVLEIGAGTGALTQKIATRVKRLIAVELDRTFIPYLQDIPGIDILQADIVKLDLCAIAPSQKLRVIGNLPYYISTAIVGLLIQQRRCISDLVLMFQEEVANRIISPPSQEAYGYLSVLAQYYCEIERGFRISRNSFSPRPEIESRVLRFRFRPDVPIDYDSFTAFLAIAFSHRRKKLRNNLLRGFAIEPEELDRIFIRLHVGENARAENLTAADYERLILAFSHIPKR